MAASKSKRETSAVDCLLRAKIRPIGRRDCRAPRSWRACAFSGRLRLDRRPGNPVDLVACPSARIL